jgi:hypothetical protein
VTTLNDLLGAPVTRLGRVSVPASVSVGRLAVLGAMLVCVMGFVPLVGVADRAAPRLELLPPDNCHGTRAAFDDHGVRHVARSDRRRRAV